LIANGDVAGVTTAMLDGLAPFLERRLDWPLPASLLRYTQSKEQREAAPAAEGEGQAAHPPTIVVTDEATAPRPGLVVLSPPSLVVGAGTASEASAKELIGLFEESMAAAGLDERSVGAVATIDRRASHGALRALAERLSVPLIAYPAERLAAAGAPHPSRAVKEAVGTPSVAEAAALTAAGSGARLVLAKTSSRSATVAVARRERPPGRLALVGIGPGGPDARTAAASTALRNAEVVVGYEGYLNLCSDLVATGTEVVPSSIGEEAARARLAVALASEGRSVAVVSSGDSGVYAMAPLVLELAGETAVFEVEVVPGVTAALAAAARLGAPLGHDHAVLSLSDLMTPWQLIRERVIAARDADLVLCLYNPRSARRSWQLTAVRELLLERRRPETPVGIVTNASRLDESVELTILSLLDVEKVGMTTCVIVGSSRTRIVGGRMVTPRGYELADEGR
jgi:cobalt-precorrin 5A hydrolase/precorrin-3B C17-methyltransferase